ncbi:unannotated protein [freshwater metagenome]|uniref:Unannotated protein n=1 Tax=freshwater metagenome TaxID=449393 RepID=A0A6J7KXX6_9ZZZZ
MHVTREKLTQRGIDRRLCGGPSLMWWSRDGSQCCLGVRHAERGRYSPRIPSSVSDGYRRADPVGSRRRRRLASAGRVPRSEFLDHPGGSEQDTHAQHSQEEQPLHRRRLASERENGSTQCSTTSEAPVPRSVRPARNGHGAGSTQAPRGIEQTGALPAPKGYGYIERSTATTSTSELEVNSCASRTAIQYWPHEAGGKALKSFTAAASAPLRAESQEEPGDWGAAHLGRSCR